VTSLFRVVTSESLRSRELGGAMLNVTSDQSQAVNWDLVWHQQLLYLLTATRLPLDVLLTTGQLQTALVYQHISVSYVIALTLTGYAKTNELCLKFHRNFYI